MANFLVGLTGGIGSGKTAAAQHFEALGIVCVDADIASRAVVEPGRPALSAITEHFGSDILQADGTLDRSNLRHRIFADDNERGWLQSLLHPLITEYLRTHLTAATSPYVILVNPLLFETRQHTWCKRVLVIDVPEEVQIARTMARDENTRAQVENIMKAQAQRQQRLDQADDVIVNDQDLAALHDAVERLNTTYLELAQEQS